MQTFLLLAMVFQSFFHRVLPRQSIAAVICGFAMLIALPAQAQSLLRDADIEFGLKQIAAPVLRAAGLSPSRVKILVVNDSSLNAFVVSNDAIFIHYGLINKLTRANMLQGIIAHEAAHITNGHITRRITNLGSARTAAGLGLALAAIAAAAGSTDAATGIAIGTQGAAQRAFLKHTRAEEASADQSGVRYLRAAGIPAQGLVDTLEIFRGQELLAETRQDPYLRSHPLSRDRIRAVQGFAASDKPVQPTDADYWFARVKGKLGAYTRSPKWTLRRLGESGYQDVRLLREAIANHRNSKTKKALSAINQAIALRPTDPFLYDMKGQILIETRQFSAATNAYSQAVKLAPREGLILSGYGRALLASGNVNSARVALEKARAIDFRDGVMLRDLSVAYAKSKQPGMASLVTAERYALSGRFKDAKIHAKRATGLLPRGSGPWQRAQDVLIASERAAKKRR
ncbi:M48 family metalloprotease [Pseudosulfitobacter sp. SM2401]|uniref:M48 family metalloprotease n=1 Tax=Pseudosulfitobacter sp. SM2401 TaxID=3350098 RepID=UPI0036F3563B